MTPTYSRPDTRATNERHIPNHPPYRARQDGNPDVIITTRWEAARWCHQFQSVLTVFSPRWYCNWGHSDHKIVEFQDRIRYDHGAPTVDDIAEVLDWAEPRKGRRMLIHCKAGQSRSVATAIAVNAAWGYDEAESFRLAHDEYRAVDKVGRRPFIPNERVLEHADTLLGTDLLGYAEDNGFVFGGYSEAPQ